MKILAFGDSIKLPTGYGRVSLNVLGYFALKGHEVIQIGWNHYEPPEPVVLSDGNGHQAVITLCPPFTGDQFHTDSVIQYAKQWKPDFIYNSNDFFTSEGLINRKPEMVGKLSNYGIVDGPGCAKAYEKVIKGLDIVVTPSKYGLSQISTIRDDAMYIPHGVNNGIYKPMDKNALQTKFGMSGKFVFGCSNRNIWRKQYPNILYAISKMKKNGMNICFNIIADPNDQQGNNIYNWCATLGLSISSSVTESADVMMYPKGRNILFPLSDNELCEAYNCWNVFISASLAEGFGLCTLESMACGVPAIICDNSANTELVSGTGWLYPNVKSETGESILIPPTIKDLTYWYEQPDYGAMYNRMVSAYNDRDLVAEYSRKALEKAQQYSWSSILPMWDTVLGKV